MQSQPQATTVDKYLSALPPDRREAIAAVRRVILANLDDDYAEGMQYGMIGYFVPHSIFPPGYHVDPRVPLPFAGLASQKNHMALYLMSVYGDGPHAQWFRARWARTGKKLDMGKACIRFRKLEDLPLEVIAETIRRVPVKRYIAAYEKSRATMAGGAGTQPTAGKAAAKTTGGTKRGSARIAKPKAATTRKPAAKSARAGKRSARAAR